MTSPAITCACPTVAQWEGLTPCPADCPLKDGYTVPFVDLDEREFDADAAKMT